uniref:Uncharacterized protein n=1 Tax=Ditylenchus dipsaci TaxID=166011 RepID=A0A915EC49_9BILA
MNPALELFEDYAKEYNELILWLPTKSPEEFQLFIHEAVRLKKRLQYLADLMAQQQQKKFANEVQKLISELDKEVERNEKSIQSDIWQTKLNSILVFPFGSSSLWFIYFFDKL